LDKVALPGRSFSSDDLFGPSVDHAPQFAALGALDALGLDEADAGAEAEGFLEPRGQAPAQAFHLGRLVEVREGPGDLGLDLDRVDAFLAVDDDPIVGLYALHLEEDVLDLGGEDVDAVDDDHVVDPPGDAAHPRQLPAAGTIAFHDSRDVARPVADEGEALLRDRREDELALLAGGQGLRGLRVDDLHDEVVLADVEAVPLGAFEGDAGAHELGEAVVVVGLEMQAALDLVAHRLAPALGAEEPRTQAQLLGVDALVPQVGGDVEGVARGPDEGGGLVVAHDHELPAHALAGGGHHRGADFLGPVMEAEPSGGEVVVEGDLDEIVLGDVGGPEDAGYEGGPGGDVAGGVADDDRLARGARGRMDPHDVLERDGEHPVRVAHAQVFLRSEGELGQVSQGPYLLDVYPEALVAVAIEGHVLAGAVEGRLEALDLGLFQVRPFHQLVRVGSSHVPSPSSSIDEYSLPR